MRKLLLSRLKSFLAASRFTAYTMLNRNAKPNTRDPLKLDPVANNAGGSDAWLFADEAALAAYTDTLSQEMNTIADSLSGLRETLSMISGETPFPVEALTQRPCEIKYSDADLFDGEMLPQQPSQEATFGGEEAFLFEEETSIPTLQEDIARQAA